MRSFDNFRAAIDDLRYFFGRRDLLSAVERSPFQVRILLGGRRIGKTSTFNAIRSRLLASGDRDRRAFPVLFNLQQERPENLEHLRYLLIARLQESIVQSKAGSESSWRQVYRRLLRQIPGGQIEVGLPKIGFKLNVTNPACERRLINEDFRQDLSNLIKQLQKQGFEGVCFLLDGAEFIVTQDWANDAWSYLRALKDTDMALKPFVGFVLSGYRDLKDYQQRVGSPLLNIAEVEWLAVLTEAETRSLIAHRSKNEKNFLTSEEVNNIIEWAGCHPYLTQQALNEISDARRTSKSRSTESLMLHLSREHDRDFSAWWDNAQRSYGFGKPEQAVYLALVEQRQGSIQTLAPQTELSFGDVSDALEVLAGTGVIQQIDDERYKIGARMFERWVSEERRYPT